MQRRDFLLHGCQACAAMIVLPAIASLESCSGTKNLSYDPPTGSSTIKVPVSVFASGNSTVISSKAVPDRLWLTKLADGSYRALELRCTHKGGPLHEEAGVMVCEWHKSRFDNQGQPAGGPARVALKAYPVTVEGDQLLIDLG